MGPEDGSPGPPARAQRRLSAILAGDIAGYSRLMGVDEEGTLARLNMHRREFLEPKIAEHRGRIVKRTGDGVLIEFASAIDAARCAIEIQHGMLAASISRSVLAEALTGWCWATSAVYCG